MNKELILKYKQEFDWWLNDGKLQITYNLKIWGDLDELCSINPFNDNRNDIYIVIDDDYVEFRKALAEGKTIQYYVEGSNEWVDWVNQTSPSAEFLVPPSKYRIKPEESKFKVGDWVISPDGTIEQIYKLFDRYPTHAQFSETPEHGTSDIDEWSLWKPKQDEWCYMPYAGGLLLSKVTKVEKDTVYFQTRYTVNISKCQPFIGELPDYLKER